MEASLYNEAYSARGNTSPSGNPHGLRRIVFEDSAGTAAASDPLPLTGSIDEPPPTASAYQGAPLNWRAVGIAAGVHIAAFMVLVTIGVVGPAAAHHQKLTTFDISAPPPPPPSPTKPIPDQSEPQLVQTPEVKTQVVAIKPMIELPSAAPALAVTPPAPPAPPVAVVAAPPAPPAPPAPITPPDFSAAQLGNAGPKYPYEARHSHHQGTVLLKVLVTAGGRAGQVKMSRSSGFDELDQAAIKAVSAWRFAPAKQAGKAVDAWVIVPVGFSLA